MKVFGIKGNVKGIRNIPFSYYEKNEEPIIVENGSYYNNGDNEDPSLEWGGFNYLPAGFREKVQMLYGKELFIFGGWSAFLVAIIAMGVGGGASALIVTVIGIPGFGILIALAAFIFTILFFKFILTKEQRKVTITYVCNNWQPPTGGKDCELCVEKYKVCDAYRCHSFGKGCELLNEGTGNETCVSLNPNDASPPVIYPLPIPPKTMDDLERGSRGYSFKEEIEPYAPVEIGINTNEPASCKITTKATERYDDIVDFFGNDLMSYNHTMNIPISYENKSQENGLIEINGAGDYEFYTRCEDANGNQNEIGYYIKFKVKEGPDMTPPLIEWYSIPDGSYVSAGHNETELSIHLNEPSYCKWDTTDTEYKNMENNFSCYVNNPVERNPYAYLCKTTITGIKVNTDNVYYFRCKDLAGNTNTESQPLNGFHLQGTIPLNISGKGPSGTLYTRNVTLKVTTINGAEKDGTAKCYYGQQFPSIEFFKTESNIHEQELSLSQGYYLYKILCVDVGGNQAQTNINFTIESDESYPYIVYIWKDSSLLHIKTNELARCQYSVNGTFVYGKGKEMDGNLVLYHTAPLSSSMYSVSCADGFNNISPNYLIYVDKY